MRWQLLKASRLEGSWHLRQGSLIRQTGCRALSAAIEVLELTQSVSDQWHMSAALGTALVSRSAGCVLRDQGMQCVQSVWERTRGLHNLKPLYFECYL